MYIVATISKNSYPAPKIREIIEAGAKVLRFNFSHGTPEEVALKIAVAREVIAETGKEVLIMADLPGNKLRLGKFAAGEWPVKKGDIITFKSASDSPDPAEYIPVDFPRIGTFVEPGMTITVGDGELGCEVVAVGGDDTFTARVLNDRAVPQMKALNIGRAIDALDHFTEAAKAHINNLSALRPELVAFSFVRSGQDLRTWKALLEAHTGNGWQPKIVAKVETPLGVANIEDIVKECDIALVARGDLGLAAPMELLGLYQKRIVAAAKRAGKEAIVSTQVLDSLLTYFIPSRAEILDVTNSILDGADGIMLAKETGISPTPGHSVTVARKIIEAVESELKKEAK